ncbi:unnamed protein product [Trifolium pratense]|uniref:Uncharacterized protein n=1 Tax=Trifolium pratense TaxID=57577 RepID=A0ACB0IGJ9_TRIPR|nr:unnamed protein product [Trifolium pratense]
MPSPKLTMRLVIDTKNDKVLFAETSKPVVDFLFYLLTLPLGTVVKLIRNKGTVGSIENVYQSVQDLDEIYMHPQQSKDHLLNPMASISSNEFCNLFPTPDDNSSGISDFLLVNELDPEDEEEEEELLGDTLFYACPNLCSIDVTSDKTTICSRCNIAMNHETTCELMTNDVAEKNTSILNGFVKNNATFLVMDDLVIQPITSVIDVVNKFNLSKISSLQDMVVELGLDEGIKLLKASLQSKKVLTSVFLKKEC